MENVLFIIPARSGSKGIKDKNIIFWRGKPLLMHTYDFLISQNINLENICVSTDSLSYIKLLTKEGINLKCFLKRPKCLAEDFVVDYHYYFSMLLFQVSFVLFLSMPPLVLFQYRQI